jgi:hypothetical protein
LTEEISNTAPKIRKNETTKTNAEIEQKKQKFSIWTTIDKVASEEVATKPIKSSTAKAIIEVQRYMEQNILDRKKDPLEW